MGNVGYVHTQDVVAVRFDFQRDRVVVILCVCRINGKAVFASQIQPCLKLSFFHSRRNPVGLSFHVLRENQGETELLDQTENIHARVIRVSQHLGDFSFGSGMHVGPVG